MVSRSEIPNNLSTTVSMDAVVKDAHARFESRMKLRLQSSRAKKHVPGDKFSSALKRFRHAAKVVMVVISFQRALQGHISKRIREDWSRVEAQTEIEHYLSSMLDFLPSHYSSKQIHNATLRKLLSIPSHERTATHVEQVLKYVRPLSHLQEYSPDVQRKLAKVLRYESFGPGRVILKQGHPPSAVYFIYSGCVLVNIKELDWRTNKFFSLTVRIMLPGECFGEMALLNSSTRRATIISKECVELLVADKQDFHLVLESTLNNKVARIIDYCSSVDLLKLWPLQKLKLSPTNFYYRYFRPNCVIISDSNILTWIAVVQSGACKVVTKVEVPSHSRKKHGYPSLVQGSMPQATGRGRKVYFSDRNIVLPKVPLVPSLVSRKDTDATSSRIAVAGTSHSHHFDVQRDYRHPIKHAPVKRQFIEIGTIESGECFGLNTLFEVSGRGLSLVSKGAECIMISKQFLQREGPTQVLQWIRNENSSVYPDGKHLSVLFQQQQKWKLFRQQLVEDMIYRNSLLKQNMPT